MSESNVHRAGGVSKDATDDGVGESQDCSDDI